MVITLVLYLMTHLINLMHDTPTIFPLRLIVEERADDGRVDRGRAPHLIRMVSFRVAVLGYVRHGGRPVAVATRKLQPRLASVARE